MNIGSPRIAFALLLRLAALTLLVLAAVGRPWPPPGAATQVVLLSDRSASVDAAELDRARAEVLQDLRDTASATAVLELEFAGRAAPLRAPAAHAGSSVAQPRGYRAAGDRPRGGAAASPVIRRCNTPGCAGRAVGRPRHPRRHATRAGGCGGNRGTAPVAHSTAGCVCAAHRRRARACKCAATTADCRRHRAGWRCDRTRNRDGNGPRPACDLRSAVNRCRSAGWGIAVGTVPGTGHAAARRHAHRRGVRRGTRLAQCGRRSGRPAAGGTAVRRERRGTTRVQPARRRLDASCVAAQRAGCRGRRARPLRGLSCSTTCRPARPAPPRGNHSSPRCASRAPGCSCSVVSTRSRPAVIATRRSNRCCRCSRAPVRQATRPALRSSWTSRAAWGPRPPASIASAWRNAR